MKKLLLLTLAMATVLTGCISDKVESGFDDGGGAVDGTSMARLNIRLSGGSVRTRALEGKGDITPGTNQIKNAHVFILDAAGTAVIDYAPVILSGDLDAISGSGWNFPDPIPADSRVFVLGNVDRDYNRTVRELKTLDAIRAFTADIWTQTDYDQASMSTVGDPVGFEVTASGSARVSIELAPVISRLELHSLEAGGAVEGFTVTGVFLTDYHTAYTFGGGRAPGSAPVDNIKSLATNSGMTGDEVNVFAQGMPLRAEMTGNRIWAYNVVATSLPLLIVRMKDVKVGSKVHPESLFLTVSSYGGVTEFKAGKIYRINKLEFTEEHLTLAPSMDGLDVDPVEWNWEDIDDPGITTPGIRIHIVPAGGTFNGTFPATGAVAQTFTVNAGSKFLQSWNAEIDNDTEFEINVNDAAKSFTVSPKANNLTTSPLTATITVTGTIATGTTRATGTIRAREVTSTYTVTQEAAEVTPPTPVESITITPTRVVSIKVGDKYALGTLVVPQHADDKTVTWSSDNTDVATINSSTGELTAVSAGTVDITATANDGSEVFDTKSITVTPPVELPPIDESSKGNIIYFAGTGDETYLSLGTWGDEITKDNYQSKMAVFKFGGIVGMDLDPAHDGVFSSDISTANNAIRFNPINETIDAYGDGTTAVTEANLSPPKVPGTLNDTPVSYNGDNITDVFDAWKVGKGDPCQLLGIPASELKAALAANDAGNELKALLDSSDRPAAYKNWVTPTQVQNSYFTDGTNSTANETISGSTNVAWNGNGTSATDPPTVTFKNATYGGNAQLPAAGRRSYDTGAVNNQGTYGYYWSSTPYNSTYGYILYFHSSLVSPANINNYTYGFAIRCVRPE